MLLGRQAAQHLLTESLLAYPLDERLHHRQRDVGLEQRHADLTQRLRHVVLGDAAVAPQPLEDELEFVAEIVEHVESVRRARAPDENTKSYKSTGRESTRTGAWLRGTAGNARMPACARSRNRPSSRRPEPCSASW